MPRRLLIAYLLCVGARGLVFGPRAAAAPTRLAASASAVGTAFDDVDDAALARAGSTPPAMSGALPAWLRGAYVRNGPGSWTAGDGQALKHVFDGYALVTRFEFDGSAGTMSFRGAARVDSAAWRAAKGGAMRFNEFGTSAGQTPAERARVLLKGVVEGGITDNAGINLVRTNDGRTIAYTEPVDGTYEVDAKTLRTGKQVSFSGARTGQVQTAHPLRTPVSNRLVNVGTELAPFAAYTVYDHDPDNFERRRAIARIEPAAAVSPMTKRETKSLLGQVSWQHSFGLCERFAVLLEQPAVYDIGALVGASQAAHVAFDWQPRRRTWAHVVDLDTGAVVTRCCEPSFFFFHIANTFEDGDDVCVDLCTYNDAKMVNGLLLDRMRAPPTNATPKSHLKRLRIPGAARSDAQKRKAPPATLEQLDDAAATGDYSEFPTINAAHAAGNAAYRFVYSVGMRRPTNAANTLVKTDVSAKQSVVAQLARSYGVVGEPVFVARPGGTAEDDGVILVVCHAADGSTDIVVVDAATMVECARAQLETPIPYGFHGIFLFDA
ncbi:carotenoid oxygenase [Pelagophyceae sp. CCMP2097]|nr:carotenoid oxygenase [Pelagophyceae sp. CCMP2097]